jgi:hypothetical protein
VVALLLDSPPLPSLDAPRPSASAALVRLDG